jgi:hypothetical protein
MNAAVSAVGSTEQLVSEGIMSHNKFSRAAKAVIATFVFVLGAIGGAAAASWFMP